MKLCEIAKQLDPHAEIKEWLDKHEIRNYTIRPDGIVDVDSNLDLSQVRDKILPVQFGKVSGRVYCGHAQLTSLQGAPQYVGGDFSCWQIKMLSYSGIDKNIKRIDGIFLGHEDATHLLGLLLVKGIKQILINNSGPTDKIMNKYLGTGDILSAQDELIDAGLFDQARL